MKKLLLILLIVGCERYVDKGKQRPNFGVYDTRFDKWAGITEYNVNGKWMTIKEYKKTEYYQSKWSEVEKFRKKENTVKENIPKFRNKSFKSLEDAQNKLREQALQK